MGCAKNSSQSANVYWQNTIIIGLFCNMISNRDIVCMERKILFSLDFCGLLLLCTLYVFLYSKLSLRFSGQNHVYKIVSCYNKDTKKSHVVIVLSIHLPFPYVHCTISSTVYIRTVVSYLCHIYLLSNLKCCFVHFIIIALIFTLPGCCFITVDCCSDPYWGCCPCCRRCVR